MTSHYSTKTVHKTLYTCTKLYSHHDHIALFTVRLAITPIRSLIAKSSERKIKNQQNTHSCGISVFPFHITGISDSSCFFPCDFLCLFASPESSLAVSTSYPPSHLPGMGTSRYIPLRPLKFSGTKTEYGRKSMGWKMDRLLHYGPSPSLGAFRREMDVGYQKEMRGCTCWMVVDDTRDI